MASVELRNVTKLYDGKILAVQNADLVIEDHEFAVLVGPSGCGKSTLLRLIAGLEEATSGEIHIDGKVVNHIPPKQRDIAMVFQNYALYPHMTVYENMGFGIRLRKMPKAEIDKQVRKTAELLHIQDILDRKPKALSGGQRQRVALGRAIVRDPKVFLFDEPLSNLDAKLRVQMRLEINRLHKRLETTMIYVTHDQVEAMTLGSKIVVLRDGVIQQTGSPLDLYDRPVNKFVAGFIGSPAMNFFSGKVTGDGKMVFQSGPLSIAVSDDQKNKLKSFLGLPVILGIRPEDIHLPGRSVDASLSEPIKVDVDAVESVGNETFVYFGDHCMRTAPDPSLLSRRAVEISFHLQKMLFFDAKSEQRIN
ncbi:sn-glycerol-3-phosphate ABC transporter ATP-binding protein UgpC [bacterium]|nr:sn-glycerol-3-phosphate ABC transporter ATP-binding protein UgpC [bacterium]